MIDAQLTNISGKTRCVLALEAYPALADGYPVGFTYLSQRPEIPRASPGIIGLAIAPDESQNLSARYAVAPFFTHKVTIEGINNPEIEADVHATILQEMQRGLYQIEVVFRSGDCRRSAQSVANGGLPLHFMSRDLDMMPVQRHIIGEVFVPRK